MPPEIIYRCAICNTERRSVNHWYVLFQSASFELMRWDDAAREGYLHDDRAQYLCGQEHCFTALSRFLDSPSPAACTVPEAIPEPEQDPPAAGPPSESRDAPEADQLPDPIPSSHGDQTGHPSPALPGCRTQTEPDRESPHPEACTNFDTPSSGVNETQKRGLTGIV